VRPSEIKGFFNLIVYRYLKTVNIMAKFELRFIDCFNEKEFIKTESNFLNTQNVIEIYGKCGYDNFSIYLDVSTAIKFAKTLRTEINKAKEVDNG